MLMVLTSDDLTNGYPAVTRSIGKRIRILVTVEDVIPKEEEKADDDDLG